MLIWGWTYSLWK